MVERIAVLIPVFEGQRRLDRTFSSLRDAVGDFDVVAVDDGSREPIKTPSDLGYGRRVVTLRLDRNAGVSAALNHGLRYVRERGYEYVARLDSGDTVAADRFQQQAAFLDARSDHAVVGSFVDFVDASGGVLFRYRGPCGNRAIARALHLGNCVIHSSAMIRAAVLREVGGYREDVPAAEDYDLFLRIARRHELAVIPVALTRCEYAVNGISVARRRRQQFSRLSLQVGHFDPVSAHSFLGVARTLLAMLVPHEVVFRLKRAYMR